MPRNDKPIINGMNHSGFLPVSNLSTKTREKAGLITPVMAVISAVIAANATALPAL